jgi:hypothetical protein
VVKPPPPKKNENSHSDPVFKVGGSSILKITHFKKKVSQILRYGGLQIQMFYSYKLSQIDLKLYK